MTILNTSQHTHNMETLFLNIALLNRYGGFNYNGLEKNCARDRLFIGNRAYSSSETHIVSSVRSRRGRPNFSKENVRYVGLHVYLRCC